MNSQDILDRNLRLVEGIGPQAVLTHFCNLLTIPHRSGNETPLIAYIINRAGQLGLPALTDGAGNLLVEKPAVIPGQPPVTLQAHIDRFNFNEIDVIELIREGDYLRANGTNLAADNGIGVAAMLAIMEDSNIPGSIDFLFTVGEEDGLIGAKNLGEGMIRGPVLLNLDSEEEGEFCIGCGGAAFVVSTIPLSWHNVQRDMAALEVKITGLAGGHSALQIISHHGNAIKFLVRFLLTAIKIINDLSITYLAGGSRPNSIPSSATATVVMPKDKVVTFRRLAQRCQAEFSTELKAGEVKIQIHKVRSVTKSWFEQDVDFLNTLNVWPDGLRSMLTDFPKVPQTSSNLGVCEIRGDNLVITSCPRSAVASELEGLIAEITSATDILGGTVEIPVKFPAWTPNTKSKLLQICRDTSILVNNGVAYDVSATHGGLETAIFGSKKPGLEMISFGPTIEEPHGVHERVYIPSIGKFYVFLTTLLDYLSRTTW